LQTPYCVYQAETWDTLSQPALNARWPCIGCCQ